MQARWPRQKRSALTELYERAKVLPGERRELCRVVPKTPDIPVSTDPDGDLAFEPELEQLRTRMAGWLFDLAEAGEKPMLEAANAANGRWDQVDALGLLGPQAEQDRKALVRAWTTFADKVQHSASLHTAAVEALTVLETVSDLLRLLERRMATFIRLRLSSEQPELLVDGRPFLDIARALHETAEAFR
jgi:hypothetical protein